MTAKTDKRFLFEVQLNWVSGKKGILSAKDATGILEVATPPAFGGEGSSWSPEHFFLSAINSCFMTTCIAFAGKFNLPVSAFECDIIGQVEVVAGKYKFTNVDLYPKLFIPAESYRDKAISVLEKTHKYCLITNSVNAQVFYHSEILIHSDMKENLSPNEVI